MKYSIEIYEAATKKKQWFFRIKSKNTQIVAHSETYTRKSNCIRTARRLIESGLNAEIFDRS
jgi:uncharacterized protein YegP (UPF0339 family)